MNKKILIYSLLLFSFSFYLSACQKKSTDLDPNLSCNPDKQEIWCPELNKCLNPQKETCTQASEDPAKTILDAAIKLFPDKKISISSDKKLSWNSQEGQLKASYQARSIRIEQVNQDQRNLLSKFLLDSAFEIDPYNVSAGTIGSSTGYLKDDLVCQLIEGYQGEEELVKKGLGELYLELLCTQI